MLELIFYTRDNQTINVSVSEDVFEQLAHTGLTKDVEYLSYNINIEDEEYEINATKLSFDNRKKLVSEMEFERHMELKKIFNNLKTPSIKEVKENFSYIEVLTKSYDLFKDEENIFFSYE